MSALEALLAPFTNQSLLLELLITFGLYLIMATSLDLATGYTGLFQLGHVGFFALGALGTTYGTHPDYLGGDLFLGVLLGMAFATLAVLVIGIPTLRLTGDYFAIGTLGLGVMVQFVLAGIYANGIFNIPTINPFGCDVACMASGPWASLFGTSSLSVRVLELVLVWAIAFGVHVLVGRIKRAPFGRVLKAIREDRMAAAAMGKNVQFLRFQALWISALFASLAGSLTVHHFQILSPITYGFPFMVLVLVMVILGGLGSHHGALLGALIVTFVNQISVSLTEVLRELAPSVAATYDLPALRIVLFAALLLGMMLLRPQGILGDQDRRIRDLFPEAHVILEVRDLHKRYGGVSALDGATFRVRSGAITGLIGPNGAGKTTLFDCITGFQKPDEGSVEFKGARIDGLAPHRITRLGMARTFQLVRLLPRLSALDNLTVAAPHHPGETLTGALLGGWKPAEREARKRAIDWLRFVGMADRTDVPGSSLSYGQSKLVEIARMLELEADMLLMDEPMAGINPTLRKDILAHIHDLKRKGKTVLIIEHDIEMIMQQCDEVIVMDRGRIIAQGPPQEVRDDPRVIQAYLGTGRQRTGDEEA